MAVSTNAAGAPRRRRRFSILTRQDKLVLALAVGIPAFIHIFLVWIPTISSIFLSFTSWNGIGGLERIKFVGIDNYVNMFTRSPPFWPALQHNLVWLLTFLFIATPIGIFFAVLLDKNIRGTRLYQSAIYLPVVLSLAIVGFIWQLQYAPEEGVLNNVIHNFFPNMGTISWLGDKNINLAAVLVAASWRHIGYIMVLYLAGLKSVDPSLREAASIDGASERQTFFRVVLPTLRPINVIVLVITVIESLRAFNIVCAITSGRNGLELLSVLVTQNIVGEASRIGFGSAIAVLLLATSLGFVIIYLTQVIREERR